MGALLIGVKCPSFLKFSVTYIMILGQSSLERVLVRYISKPNASLRSIAIILLDMNGPGALSNRAAIIARELAAIVVRVDEVLSMSLR